jgi:hypothetical protein
MYVYEMAEERQIAFKINVSKTTTIKTQNATYIFEATKTNDKGTEITNVTIQGKTGRTIKGKIVVANTIGNRYTGERIRTNFKNTALFDFQQVNRNGKWVYPEEYSDLLYTINQAGTMIPNFETIKCIAKHVLKAAQQIK